MYKFIKPHEYKGAQYILASDRLLLHGRNDLVFVGNKGIVFSTKEFHINSNNVTKINSPLTYIGPVENGQDPNNPAAKGEETVELMREIIIAFEDFLNNVYPMTTTITSSPGLPSSPNPTANKGISQAIIGKLNIIKNRLNELKSNKVFIK